jgi:hypothetical protein
MTNATAMATQLLAVDTWDLCLDALGNEALAEPPYALAQDVASAARTFLGEVFYDDTLGVPYEQQILGHAPPLNLLSGFMVQAALTVPGVVTAQFTVYSVIGRQVKGAITFTDNLGQTASVSVSGNIIPPMPPGGTGWTADSVVVTADSSTFTADG